MAAIVISPVNRKGGVGKSSSVFHLGGFFASRGMRVLLVDNEPQHSLTNGLIGPDRAGKLSPDHTTAALFDTRRQPTAKDLIRETQFTQIDLMCGSDALDLYNGPIDNLSSDRPLVLKRFLDTVRADYDIILIDNPPNLQLCTYSSLAASDFAYCITKPQEYDVQGVVPVQRAVDRVLQSTNPKLRFVGYVLNMVQARRSLHASYEALLRKTYGPKVFNTTVPDWNDFAEALTARSPVSLYKPQSKASQVTAALAVELVKRMEAARKRPPELQIRRQQKSQPKHQKAGVS
ncbi:MAG: ParA family protein [Fuerstiella sp.]